MALLAHLHTHFREKPEDLATLSLQYILSQSPEVNQAFTRLLGESLHVTNLPTMDYVCQPIGKKKERPDMSGRDETRKEIVLCEAKFYAGLTENQPSTYLKRLQDEKGAGLVFICPTVRKKSLWLKLLSIVEKETFEYYVDVNGVGMSIVTWAEVIEVLRRATTESDEKIRSDISELDSLCKMMDDNSFIPFTPEDMGPVKARLENRYYQVIEALFDELKNDKSLDHSKASGIIPACYGCSRKITIHCSNNTYLLIIYYDRDYWLDHDSSETPFWLRITDTKEEQPELFRRVFIKYPSQETIQSKYKDNLYYLALHAPLYEPLDVIAKDMKSQIIKYLDDLQNVIEQ